MILAPRIVMKTTQARRRCLRKRRRPPTHIGSSAQRRWVAAETGRPAGRLGRSTSVPVLIPLYKGGEASQHLCAVVETSKSGSGPTGDVGRRSHHQSHCVLVDAPVLQHQTNTLASSSHKTEQDACGLSPPSAAQHRRHAHQAWQRSQPVAVAVTARRAVSSRPHEPSALAELVPRAGDLHSERECPRVGRWPDSERIAGPVHLLSVVAYSHRGYSPPLPGNAHGEPRHRALGGPCARGRWDPLASIRIVASR